MDQKMSDMVPRMSSTSGVKEVKMELHRGGEGAGRGRSYQKLRDMAAWRGGSGARTRAHEPMGPLLPPPPEDVERRRPDIAIDDACEV